MEKVIVIGDGGHAKVVIDIIECENKYEIIGVTSKDKTHGKFFGYDILGNDSVLIDYFKKGIKNVAIGVGGFTDNVLRKKIFEKLDAIGFNIINAIHPSAVVSKYAKLGRGVVIFPNASINTDAILKDNVILVTNSSVDHESVIESHVLISAGVTVGANVSVGEGSLLGIGATVVSEKKIGKNTLVAAGACVVKDIGNNLRVFGIPAREK